MPIPPDARWLDALKLPLRVMNGLTLACWVLLFLDNKNHIDLSIFGSLTKPSIVVLTVVVSALTLSGIGAVIYDIARAKCKHGAIVARRDAKEKEAKEQSNAAKVAALNRLDHLSPGELRYLADCLRKGNQSFTTWVHSSHASTLAAKDLIYTPGGTHHQDHYPFTIMDFVWKELLLRKDEFIARDVANNKQQDGQRRSRL